MDRSDDIYQRGRAAFEQQAWAQAISYAGQVLAIEPTHGGALNLMIAARQQLDRAVEPSGERRVLTVLMADLVGSTRITEVLGPEAFRDVLLDLQAICVTAVTTYEGRIAQYVGDGVLAYFSYPQAHEDDAERAVLAGLQIVDEMIAGGPRFRARFGVDIEVRIGIDTGLVVVGAQGAGQWTTSDSIVGDAPNVASRIQHLATPNTVLLTDNTRRLLSSRVKLSTRKPRTIRGVRDPVVVHRALGVDVEGGRRDAPTRLVGREREVALLTDAWAAVLAGERRYIQLLGEAGIGKSRLADHLVNLVHASGGRSIVLASSSMRRHVPFHPIAGALLRLLALDSPTVQPTVELVRQRLEIIAPTGVDLDQAAVTIASLLGVTRPADLLPEQVRERTLSLLVELVGLVGSAARLLLVFEDVHNADPSTVELVQRLVGQEACPLALILTARPEGRVALVGVEDVVIGPVDEDAAEEIVRSVLAGSLPDKVEGIVGRADGIPLFLEELARWAAEDVSGASVPTALSGVLTSRLDSLTPGARDLASVAAVIGSEVSYEVLSSVAKLPDDQLGRHLAELVTARVLVPQVEPMANGFRFQHVLVREAAYARQVRASLRRVHRRCAEVLGGATSRVVPPAVIAEHYERGGSAAEALMWWSAAAQDAAATGANLEAVDQYQRALCLLDVVADERERALTEIGLQVGLGVSSSMTSGYSSEAALAAFERADELGARLPITPQSAAAIWGLWAFFIVRGELARADEQAGRAMHLAEQLADDELADTAAAMAGYVRFFQGRLAEAVPFLERGLQSRAALLPNDPGLVSMALLGVIDWITGDLEGSRRRFEAALQQASEMGGGRGAFTLAFISAYWAWLAQLSGDSAVAATRAQATIDLATTHSFVTWQAAGYLHLTSALCGLGTFDAGMAGLEATLHAWRKAGAELMVPYFLGRLADAKLRSGAGEAALEIVGAAQVAAQTNDEHVYDAELSRLRAYALEVTGAAPAEVATELEEALRVAVDQGNRMFAQRALLDLVERGLADRALGASKLTASTVASWWRGADLPPELAELLRLTHERSVDATTPR